ncbi:MAG: DUF934 domain-containing protein [Burkholderiales bacterium]|nr:DUF934 domain-containing protein [Burkholderiales bacterium]
MATLIRHRKIVSDNWQLLKPADDGSAPPLPESGDIIVPLAAWLAQRDRLLQRPGRLGVWLAGGDEPALIAEDLKNLGVVAVYFTQFSDGRGYSLGRLLRVRYGWRGELRAVGDVLRDQLFYLAGCGFDAFALRDDQDLQAALSAFGDFSEAYQASAARPLPLFRRRHLNSPDGMEWS